MAGSKGDKEPNRPFTNGGFVFLDYEGCLGKLKRRAGMPMPSLRLDEVVLAGKPGVFR